MINVEGKGGAVMRQPRTNQRIVLAVILFITLLISYLDRVNVSVLIADPQFLADMGIANDPVRMGLLLTTFLIAYGCSNFLLSSIGDRFGPRKAMCASIVLWAGSLLLGGLAPTFAAMIVARVVLGLGEGMHYPMQHKFVKNWFPPSERATANAAWLIGLMSGPAIAMPFFSWMVQAYGWRPIFFFLTALGLVPLFLLWFFTADTPRESKRINQAELDYIESGLKAEQEASGHQEAEGEQGTFWGNAYIIASDYRFWLNTVNFFCNAIIWWGTMAWLPSYLKVVRGFSWAAMGAWSAFPYVLGVVCLLVFARLSDKMARRAPFAAISLLGSAVGVYFGAMAADDMTSVIFLSLGIASLAIGMPANHTLVQNIVPTRMVGMGAGMMNGVSSSVSALTPTLIGFIIATTGSYTGGLLFLVGVGILGSVCAMILAVQKY